MFLGVSIVGFACHKTHTLSAMPIASRYQHVYYGRITQKRLDVLKLGVIVCSFASKCARGSSKVDSASATIERHETLCL